MANGTHSKNSSRKIVRAFWKRFIRNRCLFSGLGIEEAAAIAINNLDKNSEAYLLAQAYLDGINQYIEIGKTPLEIFFSRCKKRKIYD